MEEKKTIFPKILKILLFVVLIISALVIYSNKVATHGLKTKEYKIVNEGISNFHGFKIAHISDIHYGKTTFEKDLKELTDEVNRLKPDIVFFTGDLIEPKIEMTDDDYNILVKYLKEMNSNYGKYAITGNHDYQNEKYSLVMDDAGFTMLDDKYDTIYNMQNETIFIAGMSTNLYGTLSAQDKMKETINYLNGLEVKPNYTILLMHEPDYIDDVDYSFNLALAGHSHNGQVRLPLIGAIKTPEGSKKYYKEYYKVNNTDLYISSGIGTSQIGFRLFNRPSINFYRIVKR